MAALHPVEKHSEQKSSYPDYTLVLNLKDIEFPMTLTQIKKFGNQNNISINVYCIEKKKGLLILPIRFADTKRDKHVNLLYVQNDDDVEHFALIKNLSRLVSSQLSKYGHTRNSFAIGTYTLNKIAKFCIKNKNYKPFYQVYA